MRSPTGARRGGVAIQVGQLPKASPASYRCSSSAVCADLDRNRAPTVGGTISPRASHMQQPVERQGHNWHVAEDVRAYVERVDRGDRRAEGLALLTRLVRRGPDEPLRVLDVGTGQGLLAALFLDAFPRAVAVGLDGSEPMRDV